MIKRFEQAGRSVIANLLHFPKLDGDNANGYKAWWRNGARQGIS